MLPKLLESQNFLGTRLSEVLISKKLLKNTMVKGKTNWKEKQTSRKNGKLLQNAVNWQLCYIICTYSKNKHMKILGGKFFEYPE